MSGRLTSDLVQDGKVITVNLWKDDVCLQSFVCSTNVLGYFSLRLSKKKI